MKTLAFSNAHQTLSSKKWALFFIALKTCSTCVRAINSHYIEARSLWLRKGNKPSNAFSAWLNASQQLDRLARIRHRFQPMSCLIEEKRQSVQVKRAIMSNRWTRAYLTFDGSLFARLFFLLNAVLFSFFVFFNWTHKDAERRAARLCTTSAPGARSALIAPSRIILLLYDGVSLSFLRALSLSAPVHLATSFERTPRTLFFFDRFLRFNWSRSLGSQVVGVSSDDTKESAIDFDLNEQQNESFPRERAHSSSFTIWNGHACAVT